MVVFPTVTAAPSGAQKTKTKQGIDCQPSQYYVHYKRSTKPRDSKLKQ